MDEQQERLPCPISLNYLMKKQLKQFGHFVTFSQSNVELFQTLPGVCYSLCYNYLSALHETQSNATKETSGTIVNNAFWLNGLSLDKQRNKQQEGVLGQDSQIEIVRGQQKTLGRISKVDQVAARVLHKEISEVSKEFGFIADQFGSFGVYNNSPDNSKSVTHPDNLEAEINKLMSTGSAMIFLNRNFDTESGHAVCMSFKTEGVVSKFSFFDPDAGEISFIYSSPENAPVAKEAFKTFLTDYFKFLAQPQQFHANEETPGAQMGNEGYYIEKEGYAKVRILSATYNHDLALQQRMQNVSINTATQSQNTDVPENQGSSIRLGKTDTQ